MAVIVPRGPDPAPGAAGQLPGGGRRTLDHRCDQPGFLHGVVRLGRRAQHPVGHRVQPGPVRLEALR
jgi:hypothetical protein